MVSSDGGIDLYRLVHQFDGGVEAADVGGEGTQHMKGFGMIGLFGQDLAIDGFRLAQPAGAMVGDGDFQLLIVGHS